MGSGASKSLQTAGQAAIERVTGSEPIPVGDQAWTDVLSFRQPLHLVDPKQFHEKTAALCERFGE